MQVNIIDPLFWFLDLTQNELHEISIYLGMLKVYLPQVSVNLPAVNRQVYFWSLDYKSQIYAYRRSIPYQQIFRLNITVNDIQTV